MQLLAKTEKIDFIADSLGKAILFEVCTHPKPGLVTRFSKGAHCDMNVFTFMSSSVVLIRAFKEFANYGYEYDDSLSKLLPQLRELGIEYEKQILTATGNINTQRGILFAGGVLAAATGNYLREHQQVNSNEVFSRIRLICKGLVERELETCEKTKFTAGELLYKKYGITGIRGEVQEGFKSVKNKGLPALKEALANGANINNSLVHTLLSLLTETEDSNILWRTDKQILDKVQKQATKALELGSIFSQSGQDYIEFLERDFIKQRISPGGTADLLSITLAMYLMENRDAKIKMF